MISWATTSIANPKQEDAARNVDCDLYLDLAQWLADKPPLAKQTRSLAQVSACAVKLKVVADPTRLAVLEALMGGPKQVGALQKLLGVGQSVLSHHLQTLRKAGLVDTERDGKGVLYRLAARTVAQAGESAIDLGCCLISFD